MFLCNYFRGEPINRTEIEVRVGKLNGKAAGKDEVTGKMVKGGDMGMEWIWKLRNMAFESGVVPQDWRSAVIAPPYKGTGNGTECKNYKGISLLIRHGWKIYRNISGQSPWSD